MPCLSVGKTVMEVFSPSPNHHPLLRPSPSTTVLSDNPPSLIVWSNHKSPKPLVFTKCKDSGLKLEQSIVGECQLIGQVEDKYLATVCGSLLVLWDQHAVHERIRLEEMMASTLTPGVTQDCSSGMLSSGQSSYRGGDTSSAQQVRWGLGLVGTEDTTSMMDIPYCFSSLDTGMQVELCQTMLLELRRITMSKTPLPTSPRTVLEHLGTQACRGAIMFGQALPLARCSQLLHDLAQCRAPFQCAHGRPSLVVLCQAGIARGVGELGGGRPQCWRLKHVSSMS
jgi:DNA mismatch repair protein MLH3